LPFRPAVQHELLYSLRRERPRSPKSTGGRRWPSLSPATSRPGRDESAALSDSARVTFGSGTRGAASVAITGRLLEGASALAVCDQFSTGFGQAGRDGIDHRNVDLSEGKAPQARSTRSTRSSPWRANSTRGDEGPWGPYFCATTVSAPCCGAPPSNRWAWR
jgi:hypothetical protein